MRLYFVDDSNITSEKRLGFFMYGGIIVDGKKLRDLVKEIFKIKESYNIPLNTEIKWKNSGSDPQRHKAIKEKIIKLFCGSDCKIIICLTPHSFYHTYLIKKNRVKSCIVRNKQTRTLRYSTNICLQKFNHYLTEMGDVGLILADELDQKKEIKEHCFSLFPSGTAVSSLENIAYPVLPINSAYSQMHQVNDVIIGAIQHSLKEYENNFLPLFKKNFWSRKVNGGFLIRGYGFNTYPKEAKTVRMKNELEKLTEKFKRLINKKPIF